MLSQFKPRAGTSWPEVLGVALTVSCALNAQALSAAPWRPQTDAQVLETVRSSASARALRQAALAAHSGDLTVTVGLSRAYIERSRQEGDPRLLGYADGLLTPWEERQPVPRDILLLRATVLQARHEFDDALAKLDELLAIDPQSAQAWVTKATILRVKGRYAEASDACRRIQETTASFVERLCILSVDGLSGHLAVSLAALAPMQAESTSQPLAIRGWYLAELADQQERAGKWQLAEDAYRLGLKVNPSDLLMRAAYADFLLARERPQEVLEITDGNERIDALQLRRLIALRRLDQLPAVPAEALDDAFLAARRRGEELHLREEARFALDVRGDAARALSAASANWAIQREPADARVLMRAASAAADAHTERSTRRELAAMGMEDAELGLLRTP